MRTIFLIGFAVLFLVGCGVISDYQLGKSTPLASGEASPEDKAVAVQNVASVVPGSAPVIPFIGFGAVAFFTYLRGRAIRKGKDHSALPATGKIGESIGAESIVQTLSTAFAGAFEVGADNSGMKRGWKVALSAIIAGAGFFFTVPAVHDFILANPAISSGMVGLSALFAGLEKALSNVQPVAKTPAIS